MRYLSLTFDYELFFGDNNGTYDEVLFQPTYKLIDMLESEGVSATFFADVCSIPVARQFGEEAYVEGFGRQLRYMGEHGQDVQLHLHPHWFYSQWDGTRWVFSNQGYRLHEFEKDGRMNQIIADGVQYLTDTLTPADSDYRCIAYRAGGFCMQPHESVIRALFDNGIRVDSSVAPQLFVESDAHAYDYRHPLQKMNWHISDRGQWWEDHPAGTSLLEIPVATIDKSPVSFVARRVLTPDRVKLNLGPKRGSYIATHTKPQSRVKAVYDYITCYNAVSMDAYAAEHLYYQVNRLLRKRYCDGEIVAMIGHPKLVTETYIDNLRRFIERIKKEPRFAFVSLREAYRRAERG